MEQKSILEFCQLLSPDHVVAMKSDSSEEQKKFADEIKIIQLSSSNRQKIYKHAYMLSSYDKTLLKILFDQIEETINAKNKFAQCVKIVNEHCERTNVSEV